MIPPYQLKFLKNPIPFIPFSSLRGRGSIFKERLRLSLSLLTFLERALKRV